MNRAAILETIRWYTDRGLPVPAHYVVLLMRPTRSTPNKDSSHE